MHSGPASAQAGKATLNRGSNTLSAEDLSRRFLTHELQKACYRGDMDKMRSAVLMGANPNAIDSQGYAPLHISALQPWISPTESNGQKNRRQYKYVQFLLSNSANPNVQSKTGKTPLMLAALAGDLETVKLLVESGADVNAEDYFGSNALNYAMDMSNGIHFKIPRYVQSLTNGWNPLQAEDPPARGDWPTLVPGGGRGGSRAHSQWCKEKLKVARFLRNKGAPVDKVSVFFIGPRMTPLMFAVSTGTPDAVRFLLKEGADANQATRQGETALLFACYGNPKHHIRSIRILLKHGADINTADKYGLTPLMRAVSSYGVWEKPSLALIRLFLRQGANVHALDNEGRNAFMIATELEVEPVARIIKAHCVKRNLNCLMPTRSDTRTFLKRERTDSPVP
jgi:ankyrin repeat protein